MTLDASQTALARSRVYHLLGKLFLYGLTDETLPHVRAVDELADALSVFRAQTGELDLDSAAADYQHIFGFNVFAFGSTFLDETARVGGDETERVTDAYLAAGFPVVETGEAADHLGVELNFLGFLARMESEHTGDDAEHARRLTRTFLDEHLLAWLAPITVAIRRQGHPFFTALADLTLEMVCDHRADLEPPDDQSLRELPEPPDILEDPKTGLRDIGKYLLTPAYSGIYLSRDDIRALSRGGELPAGFGARRTMLNNLLRSAADYDGLTDVLDGLRVLVEQMREAHRAFAKTCPPPAGQMAEMWLGRLDRTEEMLGQIAAHV
ncbi:TorD/DmsD family molecular chaperone [Persicimonas caeni]|uniref:TorD/DmsD family molecular chaperone n=1 Tax=Persicimonas caeni TaxID=2292766 RepID=UPI00143D71F0|nr:molecular chaperone TorD family protein [Persicimonas caeni]